MPLSESLGGKRQAENGTRRAEPLYFSGARKRLAAMPTSRATPISSTAQRPVFFQSAASGSAFGLAGEAAAGGAVFPVRRAWPKAGGWRSS
jgi:hypothetical protein